MNIELNRSMKQIKSGWSAEVEALRIAAHGDTPEDAAANLETLVQAFFAPFEREGTLARELARIGLPVPAPEGGLSVRVGAGSVGGGRLPGRD
jgi:hypothetical protein